MVSRITSWKMGLGVVLFLLVMGSLGGLLYLQVLSHRASTPPLGSGDVHLLVMPQAGIEWFNGTVPAAGTTALSALQHAREAENLYYETLPGPEGVRVREINSKREDVTTGEAWGYWVLRDGQWLWGGGLRPDWMSLRSGDTLLWVYGAPPADPALGPFGGSG